jgi:hypothetical protein
MFLDRGRVCVFVIDGKDHDQQHNDDRMEISDRGRVCMFFIDGKDHDQQHNDDHMARSEAKLHFEAKLNFGVSDTKSWRSQESRLFITGVRSCEMRNVEIPKQARKMQNHDLNSISEFRIPGVGGVKSRDSSSHESQSCEM